MKQRLLGAIAGLCIMHTTASAQQEARPEDVATMDGIIRAYYEVVSGPAGEPFTRGVNSITLFYDGERWWIMNWMFDASAE